MCNTTDKTSEPNHNSSRLGFPCVYYCWRLEQQLCSEFQTVKNKPITRCVWCFGVKASHLAQIPPEMLPESAGQMLPNSPIVALSNRLPAHFEHLVNIWQVSGSIRAGGTKTKLKRDFLETYASKILPENFL